MVVGSRNIEGGGKMKKEARNFVFRNMIGLALLMAFTFLTGNPTLAAIGSYEPQKKAASPKTYQTEDPNKILEVLEKKMGGKKMSPKARDKLFTLSGGQSRLIISLCERISDDGRSAGADIAYLLVIALILLS
jgi:hypothetical protein